MQQSVVEATDRLFKKAVTIHFVNYFFTYSYCRSYIGTLFRDEIKWDIAVL